MEKSHHYRKGEEPNYYSKQIIKDIENLIHNDRADSALIICEKYMEDYPRDNLGPFYLSKVYLALGRTEDALNIIGDKYYKSKFYNESARNTAAGIYTDVLIEIKDYDEAMGILEYEIAHDKEFKSIKLRLQYLKLLVRANKLDKALEEVDKYLMKKHNPILYVKKGMILYSLGDYKRAIEAFKKANDDTSHYCNQQKNYFMGRSYYELNKRERNVEWLHSADEALRKVLTIKNDYYYCACAKLSCVNMALENLEEAEKYALTFVNNKEIDKYDYKKSDDAYRTLSNVYVRQGKLDQSLECINKMVDEFDRNSTHLRYLLYTKQYDEYLKKANHVLSTAPKSVFKVFLQEYLFVLIRLGKLDEVLYILDHLKDELNEPICERIIAFIRKEKGQEPLEYKYYASKQIADYSEDEAVKNICDGHLDCEYRPNFFSEDEARQALIEAQKVLSEEELEYNPAGLFNRYVIEKEGIGKDKFGIVNCMEAIVIPNTNNIITLYPISRCKSNYEEEFVGKKFKRLTQTEKFNQRYNK